MKYKNIVSARFLDRPNRFIANVEIDDEKAVCHVKNTGRCRELLINGAEVFLQKVDRENCRRKTAFDLIAVNKGGKIVNMDSQSPNKVFFEYAKENKELFGEGAVIKKEVKYKNSRFDFYIESGRRKIFAEVKGVTLENDGICRFPDAPTLRGVKHINELCECIRDGFEAYVIFVIQMSGMVYFKPNRETDISFADALLKAKKSGVNILAFECDVKPDEIKISKNIDVKV